MKDDKTVIFNADDFGLTPRVNRAVIEAHRDGLLTSASLMVSAPAAEHAAALARECPGLEIGLHLVLCQGRPTLPPAEIPGLVGSDGAFPTNPVLIGLKLFFAFWLRDQVRRELAAQLARFRTLVGRRPGHLNGHLNLHVHPTLLPIVVDLAREAGIPAIRLPREPAEVVLGLDRRAELATRLQGFIFDRLSARAARRFAEAGIAHAGRCYGIHRPFGMTETFIDGLLDHLEPGLTEIYAHPGHPAHGADDPELAALRSERLRSRLAALGIALTTYDDHPVARDAEALAAPRDPSPEGAG